MGGNGRSGGEGGEIEAEDGGWIQEWKNTRKKMKAEKEEATLLREMERDSTGSRTDNATAILSPHKI